MNTFKLKNSLTVVLEQRKTDSVAIQATVKTGSNHENSKINGVSHFIEHMLFEGTAKRRNSTVISNEIESLGGELNAYTSNERTCFYVKVPKKHFIKALDILSDIIQHPLFDKKTLEKERKIILKEINLHKDEPRFHQWVLFQKALFKKLPARYPTAGTLSSVKALKRKEILNYYRKYYTPNNMVISVVGDVIPRQKIENYFKEFKPKKLPKPKKLKEPGNKKTIKKEKRKVLSSYLVLGYKTPTRLEKDSYVLDVIRSVLGRGQSGKIQDEIRNKRGLAYEVGVHHEPSLNYGLFAVYLNTNKKKIPKAIKIILGEFKKLNNLTPKELSEAKGFLEGQFILENEDTHDKADELGYWAAVKDAKLYNDYLKKIRKVSKSDITRVANKYLNNEYTLAVIEQK